jgi:hypothetical protein
VKGNRGKQRNIQLQLRVSFESINDGLRLVFLAFRKNNSYFTVAEYYPIVEKTKINCTVSTLTFLLEFYQMQAAKNYSVFVILSFYEIKRDLFYLVAKNFVLIFRTFYILSIMESVFFRYAEIFIDIVISERLYKVIKF